MKWRMMTGKAALKAVDQMRAGRNQDAILDESYQRLQESMKKSL